MRNHNFYCFILIALITFVSHNLFAQNPIIRDQFSADPSARVFDGKVYLYPSHDILANEERGVPVGFVWKITTSSPLKILQTGQTMVLL